MQRLGEENMLEPCDICGDAGFPEVIVTCSKCKVFREHVYCMRIYLTNIPEDWICESCQSKNSTASPCKVNQDSGLQASKRQRTVTTGKVKFIPADEVIKLSSGNFPVKPRPANSTLPTQKASVASKNIISKTPTLTLESNPSILKLPGNGVHKNPMTDKHASLSLSKGPMKEHICENQRLLSTLMPDKEVQTLDLKIEKPTKGASCEALSARKSLPVAGSGGIPSAKRNRSNMEKSNRQSIQENFNLYHKCLPSSIAAWRGQFQILQATASGKLYDGLKAQPPCTVNIKAYRFSSRMPSVLQLESLPMLNVLTDVFQNDCPSLQDIALYFFPSDNTERSRKKFNSIFEFMNAEKLMLRSLIDGVELLVFTSNELNTDSRGTIATVNADTGYFLWGVFRRIKIDKGTERLSDMEPVDMDVDMIGGKDVDIERLPDMEPVDMDVDMIGGKDVVGRIDHVRKDKPITLHSTSKKAEETIIITSSHMNLCVTDKSAMSTDHGKEIKSEYSSDPSLCKSVKECPNPVDKLDVPPGFEAHGMVNGGRSVSNSACLVGLSGRGRVQPMNLKRTT